MDATAELEDNPVAVARTVYRPRHPVSLRPTLGPLCRGTHGPTCQLDEAGAWLTLRTPEGSTTLRLTSMRSEITATAWGHGAEWAIAAVPGLLGQGDDWGDLDFSGNALLADALRRSPGLRLVRTGLVLESLIPAILEQKVTTIQAWRAWRKIVLAHGEAAPGPAPAGLRVFPSIEVLRKIPSWDWHEAGVEPARSRTALAAASVASGLERSLDAVDMMTRLQSVPGIGHWTAAETCQRAAGDPDALSVGDYHLPAIVGWALAGEPVDDDGMLQLLARWAGQRQRVMRLILASGFRKPRFGPRMTIQDHRRH